MHIKLKRLLTEDLTIDEYLKEIPLRADVSHLAIESMAILNNVLKNIQPSMSEMELIYSTLVLQSSAAEVNIPALYKTRSQRVFVQLANQLIAGTALKSGGYIAELDYSDDSGYGFRYDVKDWFATFEVGNDELLKSFCIACDDFCVSIDSDTLLTSKLLKPLKPWIQPDMKKVLAKELRVNI